MRSLAYAYSAASRPVLRLPTYLLSIPGMHAYWDFSVTSFRQAVLSRRLIRFRCTRVLHQLAVSVVLSVGLGTKVEMAPKECSNNGVGKGLISRVKDCGMHGVLWVCSGDLLTLSSINAALGSGRRNALAEHAS